MLRWYVSAIKGYFTGDQMGILHTLQASSLMESVEYVTNSMEVKFPKEYVRFMKL